MLLTLQQTKEFEPTGTEEDPTGRLLATVEIVGVPHHLEAIAVQYEVDGEVVDLNTYEGFEPWEQKATDPEWQSMLEEYSRAASADGSWMSVKIAGREYALCLTPYCL